MIYRFQLAAGLLAFSGSLLPPVSSQAAGHAPDPGICIRSCWGARAASASGMSALTRAIVHHTAGNEFNTSGFEASKANVRAVQNAHIANGWGDIGYHFLVDKFGNIFEGRINSIPGLPRGAHDGTNTNSFGFNLMGYFHPGVNNIPTPAMLGRLYDVIAWRMPANWLPYGSPGVYGPLGNAVGFLDGHRRVKATACPGDHVFNPHMGTNMNAGNMRHEVNKRIRTTGDIRAKLDQLGGINAAVGQAITYETACPDTVGRFNHFSNGGSIYWTPSTGAHEVRGSIRSKWEQLGWEAGICGYPTTDETATPNGVGRYNHFNKNNASIYWTAATGAWSVQGEIKNKWASMGWENSSLGFPTSDEYAVAGGRRSNFQGGTLTYSFSTGVVTMP
jgi:uncharacterized protein with LGFP repeats